MTLITGRLITAGRITTCENYPQEFNDDLNFDVTSGILIEMSDDELRAAAGQLLGKAIEIRPVDSAEQAVIDAAIKYRDARKAWHAASEAAQPSRAADSEMDAAFDAEDAARRVATNARRELCAAAEALP